MISTLFQILKNQVKAGFDYFCTSYEKMGTPYLYPSIVFPVF